MEKQYLVIGETAGKIYQAIEKNGDMTTSQLEKITGTTSVILNQALGWLARESKISFQKEGNQWKISLVSNQAVSDCCK